MTPERLADGVELYHGDCREVLPLLDEVGAVVTDPPYGISFATNYAVGGKAASWLGRVIESDEDTEARDGVLQWAKASGLPWACFGTWKVQRPDDMRGMLIWDKGPAFGMGDLSFPWKGSFEEIYIGGPGWAGKRDEGVLRGHLVPSWESAGRCHPNEKPVSLLRAIIRKLPPELVILDPFAGSGTTLVAAMMEKRRAIGCEIDPAYCNIIRKRVAAADDDGLFSDLTSVRKRSADCTSVLPGCGTIGTE